MQEEVKDVFGLAINCFIAAIVIAFMVLGLSLRNEMAQARNTQLAQQTRYKESVQFSGYDTSVITGDELITLIREFYSHEELIICLDKDKNGNELYVTTQLTRQNPDLVKIESLKNRLDLTKNAAGKYNTTYQVYLVYDAADVRLVTGQQEQAPYSIVTGIRILKRNGSGT